MKKEEFIFDERYMGSLVFDHVSKVYGENNYHEMEAMVSNVLVENSLEEKDKVGYRCLIFAAVKPSVNCIMVLPAFIISSIL